MCSILIIGTLVTTLNCSAQRLTPAEAAAKVAALGHEYTWPAAPAPPRPVFHFTPRDVEFDLTLHPRPVYDSFPVTVRIGPSRFHFRPLVQPPAPKRRGGKA